jgi:hypothetical protein
MKDLAVPDDAIFPRVLAPLFQERPDIEVALRPNFGFGRMHPKSSSREGEIKNNFEPQNVSSSSKSKVGFNGTILQTPDPSSSNVFYNALHYTAPEEDQILDFSMEMSNDLDNSPAETCPPSTTIDPSLLSSSEPPFELPLSSLPAPTDARKLKPIQAGPIIYVRRPSGVSALQEAPAFSGKVPGKSRRNIQIKYRTGESASLTVNKSDVTISTGKLEVTKNNINGGRTAEAVSTLPAQPGEQSNLKIRICRPEPPESAPQTMSGTRKKRRVFVGTPLNEWNIRTIKDLKPSAVIPPLISGETCGGKFKGKAVERPRVYISDARWLHAPYMRMPVSSYSSRASPPNSDGTSKRLEDLEEGMG